MMAAGAPKRDRQIALALTDVVWNQIDQQFGDPIHKFDGLRKRSDVPRDIGMAAGELLELRDVVGVQEAHRPPSQCRAVHPIVSANHRIYGSDLRTAGLFDSTLHSRGQELSDDRVWVHWRPSSVGDDSK